MRKIFFIIIMCTLLMACSNTSGGKEETKGSDSNTLNMLNWTGIYPDSVIKEFEEETGIKVNYDNFSSNEELYAKLSVGNAAYDLTLPTFYYLEVLLKEGLIEKIDKDNIPNLKNIAPEFLGLEPDSNNDYSVPGFWGTGVIVVNEELVDKEVKGYKDLFGPTFKDSLVVADDQRYILSAMLAVKGYSPNSTDQKEIEEAGELLKELLPNIKVFDADDAKTKLINGEVKAAITYGGDAALAILEKPSLKMIYPEEYLLLAQQNYVIPKGAKNKENAEKFIDFVLRPEISKEMTLMYPSGNPNTEALKLLPENIRDLIEVPADEFEKGTHAKDVGEATVIYDRAWSEVKAHQ